MSIFFYCVLEPFYKVLPDFTKFEVFQFTSDFIKFCKLGKFFKQIFDILTDVFNVDILECIAKLLDRARIFDV